ncbi:MAG: FAD-binding oxidoreductase, partial [Gemmatimonadota bacterium]
MSGVETAPGRPRLDRVRGLLGEGRAEVVGGVTVAHPRTDEEVSALLRVAGEEGWRVRPSSAASAVGTLGDPDPHPGAARMESESRIGTRADPVRPDLVVSTAAMDRLVEHEPGDLMVRGQAGLLLADLQRAVSGSGQWLALDPPGGASRTLGGIVAGGESGPLRPLYGRPRDQVLGVTLVDGAGRILRLGGRVVKNVAGFDLVRFTTGSRGVLGVVTEVVFRLYPRPEADETLVWECESLAAAWNLGRTLTEQRLPIASAELVWGSWDPVARVVGAAGSDEDGTAEKSRMAGEFGTPVPAREVDKSVKTGAHESAAGFESAEARRSEFNKIRILIRLHGSGSAVLRLRDQLTREAASPDQVLEGADSKAVWERVAIGTGSTPGAEDVLLAALPSRGAGLVDALSMLPVERGSLHLLEGTFRVRPGRPLEEREVEELSEAARSAEGRMRWVES